VTRSFRRPSGDRIFFSPTVKRRDPESEAPTQNMSRGPLTATAADGDTSSEFANHADLPGWHSPPTSIEPPMFGPDRSAEILSGRLGPAATFATTGHFNLRTARSNTVAASSGHASIYAPR
jgi:hypothetical protein